MKNQMVNNDFVLTPDKFFYRDQRRQLMKTAKEKASLDLNEGRTTWVIRYMLVDLAILTGLRVSEIAALKIGDLNLKAKDPYLIVRSGKNSKKRTVWISKELTRHLKSFIQYKKKTLGQSVEPNEPLFIGRNGHVPTITLKKSFKKAVEAAGLPDHYSIHACRHTYATFLYQATRNLKYVQRQLGHSNIAMTSIYADILPEENGTLANKIDVDW